MSATSLFLATLGLGALLLADGVLQSERLARAAHPLRSLWAAHAGHVLLAQLALLFFGWTRLRFAPATAPSPFELALLAALWTLIHLAADILLVRRPPVADALKLAGLLPGVWLLEIRHPEWGDFAQGPIRFLGQPFPIEAFALNAALFFGAVWIGLAWRERPLALTRLGLVAIFALAIGLGVR